MDQKGILLRRLWLLSTWLDSDPMDWKGGREERHSVLGGRGERQIGGGGGKMEPNLASDVAQKATGLRQQGLRSSAPQMSKFSSNHFVVFSTTALGF